MLPSEVSRWAGFDARIKREVRNEAAEIAQPFLMFNRSGPQKAPRAGAWKRPPVAGPAAARVKHSRNR